MAFDIELRITGLAILQAEKGLIHLVDATKASGDHRHHAELTFRADDYVGFRLPPKAQGSAKLFRPSLGADFLVTRPLRGTVVVASEDELSAGDTTVPEIGTSSPPSGLHTLDQIISLKQLDYSGLSSHIKTGSVASIRLVGGHLWAGKRIRDNDGIVQRFDTGDGVHREFCDHIVWRRSLEHSITLKTEKWSYMLGRSPLIRLSMTNLPRRGWIGPNTGSNRRYFNHLGMLSMLGIVHGTFARPRAVGGGVSGGSESCSPVKER